MTQRRRIDLDRVGAMASAICAVHCLLTGAAFGLLSVMGLGFIGSPPAELAFLVVTLSVGTLAVVHGHRKHHSVVPSLFFVGGLASWLTGHLAFRHGTYGGTAFAVMGGLGLVTFHVLNQRLARRCACGHCTTGE